MKEKLTGWLGRAGVIAYYILMLCISVAPLTMIRTGFLLDLLFIGIMQFIPATSVFFWIWGLVCAIRGPQDGFAVFYYVLFAVMFIPSFLSIVFGAFSKR